MHTTLKVVCVIFGALFADAISKMTCMQIFMRGAVRYGMNFIILAARIHPLLASAISLHSTCYFGVISLDSTCSICLGDV